MCLFRALFRLCRRRPERRFSLAKMTRRTRCNHHPLRIFWHAQPHQIFALATRCHHGYQNVLKIRDPIFAHKRLRKKHVQVFVFGVDCIRIDEWMDSVRAFRVLHAARAKSTERRRVDGAISILRAHVSRRVRWKIERSRRASIIRLFDGARGRILLILVLLLIPHYDTTCKRAMVRATNARLRVEMALPCHRDASHPKKKSTRSVRKREQN